MTIPTVTMTRDELVAEALGVADGVEGTYLGHLTTTQQERAAARLRQISAALRDLPAILDRVEAVGPDDAHMRRIAETEGSVAPDDHRVTALRSASRWQVLDDAGLDYAALEYLGADGGLLLTGEAEHGEPRRLIHAADRERAWRLAGALAEYVASLDRAR